MRSARCKVLITGARGLLGLAALTHLKEAGLQAAAIEDDIRDRRALTATVLSYRPDWIVHAAAKTDVAACERDPDLAAAINVEGTANVVEAARACDARCIYVSTASVFSGQHGNYKETDQPQPMNVYNVTKWQGEQQALGYANAMVLRLNLIGVHPAGSRGKNFFEWLLDSIRGNRDMTLFSDQRINPLSNWTIARLIRSIIERDSLERILHIGSRDVCSKAELGALVAGRFSSYAGTIKIGSVDDVHDGVARPKDMWLNVEKATRLLGSMPAVREEAELILAKSPLPMKSV